MKTMIAMLAAPLLMMGGPLSATTSSAPASAPAEASIPFVNHGGIWNWQADGADGLYVQDQHRRWYYARLMNSCFDLPFAQGVGFETRGIDRLDRYGAVIVRGQRCPIASFTQSDGPPAKAKKKG